MSDIWLPTRKKFRSRVIARIPTVLHTNWKGLSHFQCIAIFLSKRKDFVEKKGSLLDYSNFFFSKFAEGTWPWLNAMLKLSNNMTRSFNRDLKFSTNISTEMSWWCIMLMVDQTNAMTRYFCSSIVKKNHRPEFLESIFSPSLVGKLIN